MSVIENKGCITYKDKESNLHRLFPITKRECVEGLEDVDSHLTSELNPHKVTATQTGAIPVDNIATLSEAIAFLGIEQDDGADSSAE